MSVFAQSYDKMSYQAVVRDATLDISSTTVENTINLCEKDSVTVTYTAIPSSGTEDYTYSWSIPDGCIAITPLNTPTCTVKYTTTGYYTVSCTATSDVNTLTNTTTTRVINGRTSFKHNLQGRKLTLSDMENIVLVQWSPDVISYIEPGITDTSYQYNDNGVFSVIAISGGDCDATAEVVVPSCVGYNSPNANETHIGEAGHYTITEVKDIQNNRYPVVKIGSQCWMTTNMRATKYANGDSLDARSLIPTTNERYYSYPNDKSENVPAYGLLYNWYAAANRVEQTDYNTVQGICPDGWHVPSKAEFETLQRYVRSFRGWQCDYSIISEPDDANALSEPGVWNVSGMGSMCRPGMSSDVSNATGFSAYPAGYANSFYSQGSYRPNFYGFSSVAVFWTVTERQRTNGKSMYTLEINNQSDRSLIETEPNLGIDITTNASVRCLRNDAPRLTSSVNDTVAICQDSSITVTYTATNGSTIEEYRYSWNGGEATDANTFTVTYNTPDTYTVTCTAVSNGQSSTKTITTEVLSGSPHFFVTESRITVKLFDLYNVHSVDWGVGEAPEVVTDQIETTHTYSANGTYTIEAISNNSCPSYSQVVTTCDASFLELPHCDVRDIHTAGNYTVGTAEAPGTGGLETTFEGYVDSVYDQNGNRYPVVQIGEQCWMAENLRATKYSSTLINTPILLPFVNNPVAGRAYYGAPDNQSVNVPMYGYLYSWDAANGGINNNLSGIDRLFLKQGICPDGWHIPSEDEFVVLSIIMGGTVYAGQMVKGCSWQAIGQDQNETDPRPGNHGYALRNELGFGALPAAGTICNVPSLEFGKGAAFWSNGALSNPNQALSTRLEYNNSSLNYGNGISNKTDGFSVRCVRNVTLSISSTEVDPTVKVCNASPYTVTYTATPSEGTDYNYSWQPAGGVVSEGGRVYTLTYRKRIFLVTGYVRLSYCESYGFEWR